MRTEGEKVVSMSKVKAIKGFYCNDSVKNPSIAVKTQVVGEGAYRLMGGYL